MRQISSQPTRQVQRRGLRALWVALFVASLLGIGATSALALSTDRDQPVKIEADWAETDDIKRVTVYKGKVVIVQGSLRISGDVVTLYFDEENDLKELIAVGRLAKFRQKPDDEPDYQRARAKRIRYDLTTDTMILTGNAQLSQGGDSMRAGRIEYDTLNARIKGEAVKDKGKAAQGDGRVRITLTPKKKCADGVKRTKCPEDAKN